MDIIVTIIAIFTRNRKVNIVVIAVIGIMADTTISVSVRFHDWLESKGKKAESYEDVIKRMLKPVFAQELGNFQGSSESSDTPESSGQ